MNSLQLLLLYFLALSCVAQAAVLQEIHPGIFIIQNSEYGIHEYNYFSVFNYRYRYNALFINGHRLPKCAIIDEEHNHVALTDLQTHQEFDETYLRTYKFPVLAEGLHQLVVVLCEKGRPVEQIQVDVLCKSMQLLFFTGTPQPCLCHFMLGTSRSLDRAEWLT